MSSDGHPADTASRERRYAWGDPALRRDARSTMTGLEYFEAQRDQRIPGSPMAATLGWTVTHVEPGYVVLTLVPGEHLVNTTGILHGGSLVALADSAMTGAISSLQPVGAGCQTIDLHVSFVRAANLDAGTFRAEAKVTQSGRRLSFAETRVVDRNGALCARVTGTFLMTSRAAESNPGDTPGRS
jgi:uncharacterized protein (TIGR00369 family)